MVFDSVDELCKYYGMTYDQVYYRIGHIKNYRDGLNFERIIDNTEAIESVKLVDSQPFVDKFGDKTVPIPGYEDKYTISTKGIIKNIKSYDRVIPVKTKIMKKHSVILHNSDNKTQTYSLINLMKKAFGDPYADENKGNLSDKCDLNCQQVSPKEDVKPVFGTKQ